MDPNVNYGRWVIMMCQCRFIIGSKGTLWWENVDNGWGYACALVAGIWKLSVPSSQFFCEPKTATQK